ncbi:MAG TPA: methionine--tRNA ligase [Thermomicrobiales bacterium]|nr:methionine--tRNA ligase [Thermomicrobiales bacterium]
MTDASDKRFYITTSIPYVNAMPHIGFALEAIQCDVLARYHRQNGDDTRYLSGTDENALTNVQAAEREGVSVRELVDRNAPRFAALQEPLRLSWDDFIRTSTDPRHEPGAQKLWRTMANNDDIYSQHYAGLYCVRCERFYKPEELIDEKCPIHHIYPDRVDEENYFFRLSVYENRLRDLITSNEMLVQPEHRREEMLSFINQGLEDFSISRQAGRGRGWGVPVPDDPNQVMYVWVDALSNYITALNYAEDGALFDRYWLNNPNRVHVVGKDIIRFHVIYWPAMLMSAGLPVPSKVNVHEFLTHEGEKMSKSRGNVVDPIVLVNQYGADAVRWWMLRDMPRTSDGDFSYQRLEDRYNMDLANDLGNLINRSVGMLHRYRGGVVPSALAAAEADGVLHNIADTIPARIERALDRFDFREALAPLQELVTAANRYVDDRKPWELNKAAKNGDEEAARQIDTVLANLIESLRVLAVHLRPFLPDGADRISGQLNLGSEEAKGDTASPEWGDALAGVTLPKGAPVFPRIEREEDVA